MLFDNASYLLKLLLYDYDFHGAAHHLRNHMDTNFWHKIIYTFIHTLIDKFLFSSVPVLAFKPQVFSMFFPVKVKTMLTRPRKIQIFQKIQIYNNVSGDFLNWHTHIQFISDFSHITAHGLVRQSLCSIYSSARKLTYFICSNVLLIFLYCSLFWRPFFEAKGLYESFRSQLPAFLG